MVIFGSLIFSLKRLVSVDVLRVSPEQRLNPGALHSLNAVVENDMDRNDQRLPANKKRISLLALATKMMRLRSSGDFHRHNLSDTTKRAD